jgi:hypothetical protein
MDTIFPNPVSAGALSEEALDVLIKTVKMYAQLPDHVESRLIESHSTNLLRLVDPYALPFQRLILQSLHAEIKITAEVPYKRELFDKLISACAHIRVPEGEEPLLTRIIKQFAATVEEVTNGLPSAEA